MQRSPIQPSREQFNTWVRDTLSHLHDPAYLQTHTLAILLAQKEAGETLHYSQSLKRVLLESIQAMRPGQTTPQTSPDWRAYYILELRFVEGLGAKETRTRLVISKSLYYREQKRALHAVSDVLWMRYLNIQEQSPA